MEQLIGQQAFVQKRIVHTSQVKNNFSFAPVHYQLIPINGWGFGQKKAYRCFGKWK